MQEKNRKRRRLAVQISLMVTAMAVVMMYTVGSIVVNTTTKMYIESHNEQITREMEECKSLFLYPEIAEWVLDQWQSSPDLIRESDTEDDFMYSDELESSKYATEAVTLEELRELEEENRIQRLAEQNRALKEELRELTENYDLLIDILSGGK